MSNPHQVTRDFEAELCRYTGAKYAVAVNSCTMALLLACKWALRTSANCNVAIPKYTYVGVPMSVVHAGGIPRFVDKDWYGYYRLGNLPVYDSARYFTSNLFNVVTDHKGGGFVCVSFHASKTLGLEQGGAILHDDDEADDWFRRMRFDGRTEGCIAKLDDIREIGFHCYMNPSTAAQGLLKLHSLPKHNPPLQNDDYPDLSKMEAFR